jgi:anhydro-N-acetylmuramic acid kinase
VVLPDRIIVDFKEALIFAFLGALRKAGEPNALASVTGAKRDSVGGAIYSAS